MNDLRTPNQRNLYQRLRLVIGPALAHGMSSVDVIAVLGDVTTELRMISATLDTAQHLAAKLSEISHAKDK